MDNNDKPEECKVCFNEYDEDLQRPRTLPCGHTFCSQCIEDTIKNVQLTCPGCRAQHTATAASHFPVNYIVEALIKKLKAEQHKSVGIVPTKHSQLFIYSFILLIFIVIYTVLSAYILPNETGASVHTCICSLSKKTDDKQASSFLLVEEGHHDHPKGVSKKLGSIVQDQKSSINNIITECEDVLSQLEQYQGQVREWKTQHHQLHDRLYDLLEQNKAALELLKEEDTRVTNMTTEGEAGKKELQVMLKCLGTVNTGQEAVISIDEADQCNMEVEDWLQKCQKLFPDVNTVHTSIKVQETIKEALATITTGATAVPLHLPDSDSTIIEKVEKITDEFVLHTLTVEDLLRMSERVKRLVEAGRVFAVQQGQDDLRYSRITLQDGQLYLHTLLRQPPPSHAHTLKHSKVMEVLDTSSTLVFLDLAWAGLIRGRVHIRLTPDTGLATQFVWLSSGERGPSYHNTTFFKVEYKGEPGESVTGGDYQHNNGKGGAPLLSDQQDEYRESGKVGAVSSPWWQGSHFSTQFTIITRDATYNQYSNIFGEVESGMNVLRAAVDHSNIKEVTVVDCGVVLAL